MYFWYSEFPLCFPRKDTIKLLKVVTKHIFRIGAKPSSVAQAVLSGANQIDVPVLLGGHQNRTFRVGHVWPLGLEFRYHTS